MAGAPVVAAPPAGFKPGLEAAPIAKPVGVLEAVNAAKARQQEAVVNAKLREKAGTPANQQAFEQTQNLLHEAANDMEEHIPEIKEQRAKLVAYQTELKAAQNDQQRQEIQERMNADCADAIMIDSIAAASQMNRPGQETVAQGKKQKIALGLARRYYADQAAHVYDNNPDASPKQNRERYANMRDRAEAADRLSWTVGEVVDINHPTAVRRLARWVGNGIGRGMRSFARGADWVVQDATGTDWTPFQRVLGTRGRTPAMLPMADTQLQAMDRLTARMETGDQTAFTEARRMANDMLQADREAILKQANSAVEKPVAVAPAGAKATEVPAVKVVPSEPLSAEAAEKARAEWADFVAKNGNRALAEWTTAGINFIGQNETQMMTVLTQPPYSWQDNEATRRYVRAGLQTSRAQEAGKAAIAAQKNAPEAQSAAQVEDVSAEMGAFNAQYPQAQGEQKAMVEAALRAAPKDKRQLILTAIMALGGGGILAGSMGGVTNSETVAVAPVAA